MKGKLTFEEFRTYLSGVLLAEERLLSPEASLVNDLQVDSLRLVELLVRMETEFGMSMPSEVAWRIETVGDAYQYYAAQAEGQPA